MSRDTLSTKKSPKNEKKNVLVVVIFMSRFVSLFYIPLTLSTNIPYFIACNFPPQQSLSISVDTPVIWFMPLISNLCLLQRAIFV